MAQSRRIKKPVKRGKSRRMKGGLKPRIRNKKKLTRRNFKIKKGGGSFITIYILCFNEEKVIDFTINAYRKLFPNCKIVIYDNESTNTSAEKAKALNCEVKSFSTGGILNEIKMTEMRNTVWKDATTPWVIVCDMDEIIGVNQNDLIEEDKKGVNVLQIEGYDMYGKSEKEDLSNIVINAIKTGEKSVMHSKTLCFRQDKIETMNFEPGAHKSNPIAKAGNKVTFSEKKYILYHFKKLGKSYYSYTQKRATPRAVEMAKIGMSTHYTENEKSNEEIIRTDNKVIVEIPALSTHYMPS